MEKIKALWNVMKIIPVELVKLMFGILIEVCRGVRGLTEEVVAILKVIVRPITTERFRVFAERVLTYGLIVWVGVVVLNKIQHLVK